MTTISNIDRVSALLGADVEPGTTKTVGLAVSGVDVAAKTATVQSSGNADLQVVLRGVTGLAIGTVVSVDLSTGDVATLSQPAAPVAPAPSKAERGCADRSFIAH